MRFARVLGAALWWAGATAGAAAGDLAVVGTGDGLEVLRTVGAAYTADHSETVRVRYQSLLGTAFREVCSTSNSRRGTLSSAMTLWARVGSGGSFTAHISFPFSRNLWP
jgi:hypothetical protein